MARMTAQEVSKDLSNGKAVTIRQGHVDALVCPPEKNIHFLWDKPNTRGEGLKGFGVSVSPNGSKAFVFKDDVKIGSEFKSYRVTVAKCTDMTLEDARQKANELRLHYSSICMTPRMEAEHIAAQQEAQRQIRETAAREAEAFRENYSLQSLLKHYWEYLQHRGKSSWKEARNCLTKHVINGAPKLASLPANEVQPRQIADLLRAMGAGGITREIGKVRSYLAAAYSVAKKAPLSTDVPECFIGFNVTVNAAAEVPVPEAGIAKARDVHLNIAELTKYVQTVQGVDDEALRFVLLAQVYTGGQRFAQLLRAKREHYDPCTNTLKLFDLKGKRKEPRVHNIPLATEGARLFNQLSERAKLAGSVNLFFSPFKTESTLDETTVSKAGNKLCVSIHGDGHTRARFQLRDIRRTIETYLSGQQISRETRAHLQSHGLSGVQIQHYDFAEHTKEKREALAMLELALESKPAPVITLQTTARKESQS